MERKISLTIGIYTVKPLGVSLTSNRKNEHEGSYKIHTTESLNKTHTHTHKTGKTTQSPKAKLPSQCDLTENPVKVLF